MPRMALLIDAVGTALKDHDTHYGWKHIGTMKHLNIMKHVEMLNTQSKPYCYELH